MKDKLIGYLKWIKNECKDWKTFLIFLIVVLIVYSPTWGGYLLYLIFKWKWCLAVATSTMIFWVGPFTPFIPLCIAITFGIKGIMEKWKNENTKNSGDSIKER